MRIKPWQTVGMLVLGLVLVTVRASAADEALRVLFVGNSYTASNELPRIVARLGDAQGLRLEVEMRAEPDFAIADHFGHRGFDALLKQDWDWVVLQQGPSALPSSRRELLRAVRRVARRLEGRETRIALFSAWPQLRHRHMSEAAEANYAAAAETISACVLPVASAWRTALEQAPELPLYQPDGLHPTALGSLLAAMAILDGLLPAEQSIHIDDAGMEEAARARLAQLRDAVAASSEGNDLACRSRPESH